jgi:hypothetical protein
MGDIPYSNASSGSKAREEITSLLRRIGCDRIGFMDEYASGSVLLAFEHRGRPVQMRASAKGWATWFLRENPWSSRRSSSQPQWEKRALDQGMIAVNSILRDWTKGQVTAIECGLFPAEAAFFAHMITADGRSVLERVNEMPLLLAPPGDQK